MKRNTQQQLFDLVKKNYEEIADEYDQIRKKYASPLWQEIEKYAKKVKRDVKVLDVGCGNGKLLEFLATKVDYLGVDSSKEMIKIVKSKFPKNKFEIADILNLQEVEESDFDYIFCIAVLHHIPGQGARARALREMTSKLNKNGQILISVWNLWEQKKFKKLIIKNIFLKLIGKNKMDFGDIIFNWKGNGGQTSSKRYYHAFSKLELQRLVKKTGLNSAKIYKDKFNFFIVIDRKQT